MKLELNRNSLFAVLLRSPWWIAALVAAGIFGVTKLFLPAGFALFAALPFIVIALYAAWKQLRAPSAARIAKALERLTALSREEFTAALEAGWREQGYEVSRSKSTQVDLELRREGRLALVGCRRWKAASTGVEPLRELHAAGRAREAQELIYVAAGEITQQARAFAEANAIRLVHGAELAALTKNSVRLKRG
jgi:restriction system protein